MVKMVNVMCILPQFFLTIKRNELLIPTEKRVEGVLRHRVEGPPEDGSRGWRDAATGQGTLETPEGASPWAPRPNSEAAFLELHVPKLWCFHGSHRRHRCRTLLPLP